VWGHDVITAQELGMQHRLLRRFIGRFTVFFRSMLICGWWDKSEPVPDKLRGSGIQKGI